MKYDTPGCAMQLDARLSRMLHILIHMDHAKTPMTSELAGQILDTNPVVVRRMMAGLRDAGHVASVKGHGGGWTLQHGLEHITMLDVYRAVGAPRVLSIGASNPAPTCLVEQAVNARMALALEEAEALFIRRLGQVTLAEIAGDFDARLVGHGLTQDDAAAALRAHPLPG
jgi:DNA-binding IscR family transcriptional regulator